MILASLFRVSDMLKIAESCLWISFLWGPGLGLCKSMPKTFSAKCHFWATFLPNSEGTFFSLGFCIISNLSLLMTDIYGDVNGECSLSWSCLTSNIEIFGYNYFVELTWITRTSHDSQAGYPWKLKKDWKNARSGNFSKSKTKAIWRKHLEILNLKETALEKIVIRFHLWRHLQGANFCWKLSFFQKILKTFFGGSSQIPKMLQ